MNSDSADAASHQEAAETQVDCQDQAAPDVSEAANGDSAEVSVPANIDKSELGTMVKDVLGGVRALRESLDERAAALQTCRHTLDDKYAQASQEWQVFARQQSSVSKHLARRETQLKLREEHCGKLEQRVRDITARHEAATAELREREQSLQARADAASQRDQELTGQEEALKQRQEQLDERQRELDSRDAALREDTEKLQGSQREVDDAKERLDQERSELENQRASAEEARRELEQQREDLGKEQEAIAKERTAAHQDTEALRVKESQLAEMSSVLEQQRSELDEQQKNLTGLGESLNAKIREVQAARERLMAFQAHVASALGNFDMPEGALSLGGLNGLPNGEPPAPEGQ
jgi:chromosome segregation ATPase